MQTTLVIKDAHIITDMLDADLFHAWLSSENKLCVPDFASWDFRKSSDWRIIAPLITQGLLEVNSFEGLDMPSLHAITREKKITMTEASAVHICQNQSGIIVTHDPKLKKICESVPVPCEEILWIFDHLLENGSLPFSSALEGLNTLTTRKTLKNSTAIQKRMDAWARQEAIHPNIGLALSHDVAPKGKIKVSVTRNNPEVG